MSKLSDILKKVSVDGALKGISTAFNGLVVAGGLVLAVQAADVKAEAPAAPQQVVEPA